jgi:hypothetical protein
MGSTIITVLYKSGVVCSRQISCVDEGEAQAIMLEITEALAVTPIISIEAKTTTMVLIATELACVSLGETVHAVERQAPQQIERLPTPPRRERPASWGVTPALIAN